MFHLSPPGATATYGYMCCINEPMDQVVYKNILPTRVNITPRNGKLVAATDVKKFGLRFNNFGLLTF